MDTQKPIESKSGSGRLVAALVFLVAVAAIVITGQSILSPGPLNAQAAQSQVGGVNTHANLSGQCSACHAPPWSSDTMAQRCLKCHTDVAAELQNPHTLHGMSLPAGSSLTCKEGCHTEHRGATALLTLVSREHSPRNPSGYSLQGHQTRSDGLPFACLDCHQNGLDKFDVNTCTTCHLDVDTTFTRTHLDTFGAACLQCHDGVDTYGKAFDHNRASFKLLGKHGNAACSDCHQNARTIAQLKAAPQSCNACHQKDDKHQGSYGQNCAQCHNTSDWKQATIDHSKTAFALTGKHVTTACPSCHVNGVLKGTPSTCNACHRTDDKHNGSLGQNCAQCHNTTDWKQAAIDHSRTSFPLTGEHANTPCNDCHINGVLKGTATTCNACHQKDDKHNGSLGPNCAQCHNTTDWKQATIDHSKTAFALTGKHVTTACASCHVNGIYKGTATTCNACHQKDDKHQGSYGQNCAQCHNTTDWKQATIDHSKTAFALTGKHVTTACASCHVNGIYKGTANTCYACHKSKDTHQGSFGQNCAECHNTNGWTPATYNRSHRFPRNHGRATTCKTCHTTSLLTYSCYGCHEHTVSNIQRAHRNTANLQDCVRCHPTGRE